jgi:hypothetical protein
MIVAPTVALLANTPDHDPRIQKAATAGKPSARARQRVGL